MNDWVFRTYEELGKAKSLHGTYDSGNQVSWNFEPGTAQEGKAPGFEIQYASRRLWIYVMVLFVTQRDWRSYANAL